MNDTVKLAMRRRDSNRHNAIAAIKSTQNRLKPKNLAKEAKDNARTKASLLGHKTKATIGRHRGKLWAIAGVSTGIIVGTVIYTPAKKWLSENRKT